ncbi:TldD/PmbA family protein [Benzoatithermus flavus]|uniref:TldD/PmbA family protein n=1 Tax=Benzoatithermus flavus TaxID=3108223 RepID=A0ABU8XU04_9PROT
MTDDSLLLEAVLAAATRAGADAADALLVERTSLGLSWRLGALEGLERKEERELGVRVLVGRRVATAATNRLDADSLRALSEEAVATARLLPEDPWAGLAAPEELAAGVLELDLADPAGEPAAESLQRAAATAEAAARAVPGVTNTDGASASWSAATVTLAATNGFSGSYRRTRFGLGVTVLAGSGTAMQRDHEYRQATHRADLPAPEAIGRTAGERTVRRLGPRKVATTRVPVVFEPRAAAGLLRHLAAAIGGEAVAAGRTFLENRLGQPVFGPGVTIVDDPLRPRGLASRPFDGEGIAGTRRKVIDGGVLTTWLLDLATARRLGLASTGHASRGGAALGSPGPTNFFLEPGVVGPETLIADIAAGFYVTEMMGVGVNTVTGDYSRGAAGFWIENGAIAYPVSEVTVAGNLAEMFARLVPASDLELRGAVDAPTLRIDGLVVAGR